MSKNQPSLKARGRFGFWNLFLRSNSKRSCLLRHSSTFSRRDPPPPSMVGVAGFEPATLRLSSACSNQLSYTPIGEGWWRHGDSNPRPIACKATALPTELCPQKLGLSGFELPVADAWRIEAKTELCATVSESLSLNAFRC
jgi:hypothetical protein